MDGESERAHARLTTEGGRLCPVCREPARRAIDVDDYALFACPACGCWSSDALVRGAATSFVPAQYFGNAALDRPKWDDLRRRIGPRPLAGALDVGCGTGHFLAYLHAQYPAARLVGIELDPERAARARALVPAAAVHVGDAAGVLDRLDARFDLITLWDVFEHLPDPVAVLQALASRLAPDGRLFVQTIHERSLVPAAGRWLYRLSGGRLRYPARRTHEAHHVVFFTRAGLARAAAAAGLAIERLWFDRLARQRMDGGALLTTATALLLSAENAFGNGLFVNVVLTPAPRSR
ncbi:MAG: class I SAM-dependent methyltransferase [Candidatus Binatia bacterium]